MPPIKKKRRKKSKNYFTQETEDAIVLYNSISDSEMKSKIYEEKIHYPFFKLTQNIIHTFKFYHTEVENLEHLQHEIIVFLLSKIHLFNPDRGSKAYSYFGTIVKRWCILYNDKNYKKKIVTNPIEEINEDESHSYNLDISNVNEDLSFFLDKFVDYVSINLYNFFPKPLDARIADSVLELFRKRENIDVFNKKALYIYLHEMLPEVKTPKITKISQQIYNIFKKHYLFYLENGYINF
tara:strand:+ start:2310 stop:3023 length:714 start_codon:yes stop_codon:yes gene_type:complete